MKCFNWSHLGEGGILLTGLAYSSSLLYSFTHTNKLLEQWGAPIFDMSVTRVLPRPPTPARKRSTLGHSDLLELFQGARLFNAVEMDAKEQAKENI